MFLHNLKWTRLTRVSKTPRLATIRIGEIGFEAGEASALPQKIQCAISSRAGACQLAMSSTSGFNSSRVRFEPRRSGSLLWFAAQPAANTWVVTRKIFFRRYSFCFRDKDVPLGVNCLADLALWGKSEATWPFRLCCRTIE